LPRGIRGHGGVAGEPEAGFVTGAMHTIEEASAASRRCG
jgi:hypothetical protein